MKMQESRVQDIACTQGSAEQTESCVQKNQIRCTTKINDNAQQNWRQCKTKAKEVHFKTKALHYETKDNTKRFR